MCVRCSSRVTLAYILCAPSCYQLPLRLIPASHSVLTFIFSMKSTISSVLFPKTEFKVLILHFIFKYFVVLSCGPLTLLLSKPNVSVRSHCICPFLPLHCTFNNKLSISDQVGMLQLPHCSVSQDFSWRPRMPFVVTVTASWYNATQYLTQS